jgi:hypothetical protein
MRPPRQWAHEIEENVRTHSGIVLEREEALEIAAYLREVEKCR